VARRLEEILAKLIEHEGAFPLADYLDQHFADERAADEARLAAARERLLSQRNRRRRYLRALLAAPALLLITALGLWGAGGMRTGAVVADDLLAAGGNHTCAREGGELYCWGKNNHGQIGNGAHEVWTARQRVPLDGVVSLGLGGAHSCACVSDGQVHCWGRNERGQLGMETAAPSTPRPTLVPGVTGCRQVAAGDSHSCALVDDGAVYCWGHNLDGQTGAPPSEQQPLPRRVADLAAAISIAAGGWNSCALAADRRLWCWGDNVGLGDGGTSLRSRPEPVPGLTDVAEVSVGTWSICARKETGDVVCWGRNNSLRFDGTHIDRLRPVPVPALAASKQLAVGQDFACVLRAAGDVACFGGNGSGQLGVKGDRRSGLEPGVVAALGSVHRVVAGAAHACARHERGISCWGSNEAGQLGDGKGVDSAHPVAVGGPAR